MKAFAFTVARIFLCLSNGCFGSKIFFDYTVVATDFVFGVFVAFAGFALLAFAVLVSVAAFALLFSASQLINHFLAFRPPANPVRVLSLPTTR